MINSLPAGYITTDTQGKILDSNDRADNILNMPKGTLQLLSIENCIDDRDVKEFKEFIADILKINTPQSDEFRLKTANNDEVWLGIHAVVYEQSTETDKILVFIITEINQCTFKLGVDKLEERYSHLDHLLETSSAVIFSCLPTGDYPATYISKNIQQKTGYKAEQFTNIPEFWVDHIHPDDKSRLFKDLQKLEELDYSKHHYRFQHKNGEYRWIEEELRLIRDENGDAKEIVGSWNDITERLLAEDSAQSLGKIVENSLNEVYIFDATNYHFLFVNCGARNNLGYSLDELYKLTPLDLKTSLAAEKFSEYIAPLKTNKDKNITFTTKHQRSDGTFYPVEVHLHRSYYQGKDVYVAIILDISERIRAQKESVLIAQVMKQSNEGIMVTDISNRFISVNSAFCNITGYSESEVLGQTPGILQSGRHDKEFYQALWAKLESTGEWEGEIWNRKKDGEIYSEWLKIYTIKDSDGKTTNYVGHSSDIISHKEIRDRLQHLAHYDNLTGLCNRYFFMELLENAIAISQREEKQLCLLFIDLDGFKLLNDAHGHLFGDEVLKKVAEILSSCVRKSDIVARFSGDEFVIVLTGLNKPDYASDIAKIILQSLSTSIEIDNLSIQLFASIGISNYPKDGTKSGTLISKADQAMYKAKNSRDNYYCMYEEDIDSIVLM